MLQTIADGLDGLNPKVVFVGGATAGFYATNPGAPEARPTLDVDCVIEIASYVKQGDLETTLRKLGFKTDLSNGTPICRWEFRGIKVDIMPVDPSILGFSNRWYKDGVQSSIKIELPNKTKIRIFTAPYFIASKIEAFKSRGRSDMRISPDFEDMIYVLDNMDEIVGDLKKAERSLTEYVQDFLGALLNNEDSDEAIAAALPYGAGQAGIDRIKKNHERNNCRFEIRPLGSN
jgi:predicted nucleotidyltransferase